MASMDKRCGSAILGVGEARLAESSKSFHETGQPLADTSRAGRTSLPLASTACSSGLSPSCGKHAFEMPRDWEPIAGAMKRISQPLISRGLSHRRTQLPESGQWLLEATSKRNIYLSRVQYLLCLIFSLKRRTSSSVRRLLP